MFANRRPGKRSIVGTRVCAPYGDGLYAPGVIQSISSSNITGRQLQLYAVQFDNGVTVEGLTEKELIGPGFQSLNAVKLLAGQTVYITYNGREVKGCIVDSSLADSPTDELMIIDDCVEQASPFPSTLRVLISGHENIEVTRKVEEVRLMESRKSARLQDQDTDYFRLADPPLVTGSAVTGGINECKKRTVSSVIDVPNYATKYSRSGNFSREEHVIISDVPRAQLSKDEEAELMNDHMAAMVLSSLSCSPVSPIFPFNGFVDGRGASAGSSGVWSTSEGSSVKGSIPSTPSPPKLLLSQSAPADVHMFSFGAGQPLRRRGQVDEGFDAPDDSMLDDDDDMKISKRTVYKCTWPGCKKLYNTCPGVEQHIRIEHLGPKDDTNVLDEHEEEFYFTEVEVSLDAVLQTFNDVTTSSPPTSSFVYPSPGVSHTQPSACNTSANESAPQQYNSWASSDHDYQRKEFRSMPLTIPGGRGDSSRQALHKPDSLGLSLPISIHFPPQSNLSSSLPWPMSSNTVGQLSPTSDQELTGFGLGPGASSTPKKPRTEVKKCRKVYGLENRSLWCTQCKWKKACTRFQDKMDLN